MAKPKTKVLTHSERAVGRPDAPEEPAPQRHPERGRAHALRLGGEAGEDLLELLLAQREELDVREAARGVELLELVRLRQTAAIARRRRVKHSPLTHALVKASHARQGLRFVGAYPKAPKMSKSPPKQRDRARRDAPG